MNLKILLKALGINVPAEDLAKIEAMIPQLPAKVNELIAWNVRHVTELRVQLDRIERKLDDASRTGSGPEHTNSNRYLTDSTDNRTGPVAAD